MTERRSWSDLLVAELDRPIVAIDGAGTIRRFNGAAEQVLGVSRTDAVGHPAREVARRCRALDAALAHLDTTPPDQPWKGELPLPGAGGGSRRWLWTLAVVAGEDGQDDGAVLWGRPRTQILSPPRAGEIADSLGGALGRGTMRVEEALLRTMERFRLIFDEASDAMFILDRRGRYIDANTAALDLLGYTRDELLQMTVWDLVHTSEHTRLDRTLDHVLHGDTTVNHRLVRHKSGDVVPMEIGARLMSDGFILSIGRDLRPRRRVEESLRSSEEKFRALTEASTDLIVRIDRHHHCLYANAAAQRHRSGGEAEGCDLREMGLPEHLASIWYGAVDRVFSSAAPARMTAEGPGDRWYDCSLFPEFDADGEVHVVTIAARDISDVVEAQEQRRLLETRMHESQKLEAIGRLAGGVAHDFNNLLTGILGYTELIRDGLPPDDPARADLAEIYTAARRSSALVQQLLAFGRSQMTRPRHLDLDEQIERSRNMLQRLIGEDIVLTVEPGGDLDTVLVDPSQIDQILVNLAVNARDAMPEGGTLTIRTSGVEIGDPADLVESDLALGAYVQMEVADSGAGMDEPVLQRLFEPFFTTKPDGKGSGLGLATVYGIVRQNDGQITVESTPGKGTVFRVLLPVHVGEDPRESSVPGEGERGGGETVLLVEDDETVRQLAFRILVMLGYEVLVASDGAAALEISESFGGSIDLLLTDVVMPGINGLELARRIGASRPEMTLLLMTGYSTEVLDDRGIQPDKPVIRKPFSIQDLGQRVRDVLDAR